MNELLKLLELVEESKKAEAQKLVDAVKTFIGGLDTKINDNERLKNDAITSRDKIKAQLKDIGTKLGIDIDTDNVVEAIEAIKKNKGVDKSEALIIAQKEIDGLKNEVTDLNTKLKDADANTSKQMLAMTLKTDIAKVLPDFKAKANGITYITEAVEKQATFEDGKVVFKNEDGTTLRIAGKDATVADVIKQMKDKEVEAKESLFFNIDVQDSGAKGGGGKETKGDYVP
jgi:hypothetical protein